MSRSRARRECEQVVSALDLPHPFDLGELCAGVGRLRGKPVVLMATQMAMGGGLCGMWLGTATADYVFYEEDTSKLHQQHIVCHELGHILRKHTPSRILGADIARSLTADVDPGQVQRVLGRDTYSDADEYEAELIATLILRRIGRTVNRNAPAATDPKASEVIERISRSLSQEEP